MMTVFSSSIGKNRTNKKYLNFQQYPEDGNKNRAAKEYSAHFFYYIQSFYDLPK